MNLKISGRYIITVATTVTLVILINLILVSGLILNKDKLDNSRSSRDNYFLPEEFTVEFASYIGNYGDDIGISQEGKQVLQSHKAWIQIIDIKGQEVYNYNKPENVQESYRPVDLIQAYKYSLEESMSTIFIWQIDLKGINYNYIIGFPYKKISRSVITYDNGRLVKTIEGIIYMTLFIDIPIAIIFAYIFSRRLTSPLEGVIEDVKELSQGNYSIEREEKGIYKEVYTNINNLSSKLRSNYRERIKLDRMREEWISNISHDIKTPLVSIKGYAEILADEDYNLSQDEIVKYARIINERSDYIKELIDDLNLSSRLKNKNLSLNLVKVNLVSLLRETVIEALNNPELYKVDIEFIPSSEVIERLVDKVLIKRVITNILYNSIIHNNNDVSIRVKIEEKDRVHIHIQDNGKGIKKEDLEHIFERYYRGTNTDEDYRGSGLGLAISNDIVKAHSGHINMQSQAGEGTKIEIVI